MRAETPREYFENAEVVDEYAAFDFLLDPEQRILTELAPRLASARLLDLGVGGGRTTVHLADRVAAYVGLDYSRTMVQAARERFDEQLGERLALVVGDARHLTEFDAASFDVVVFSFNGIDTVGDHDDRIAALREITRVCRPGGAFVFSTHNLLYARQAASPWRGIAELVMSGQVRLRPSVLLRHPELIVHVAARRLSRRRLNPPHSLRAPHVMLLESRPRYELNREHYTAPDERIEILRYSVTPREQLRQLAECGFGPARVWAPDGAEVTGMGDRVLSRHQWLYFLAMRSGPIA